MSALGRINFKTARHAEQPNTVVEHEIPNVLVRGCDFSPVAVENKHRLFVNRPGAKIKLLCSCGLINVNKVNVKCG